MAEERDSLALFREMDALALGDPYRHRLRHRLVEMHVPLAEGVARRFQSRREPFEDLKQVGVVGLIKAVDRFNLDYGVQFETYAIPTIVGEIKRHFRDCSWAVRVPRRLQELRLSLLAAVRDLTQLNGRSPTVAELAAYLELSEEEIIEGLASANAYTSLSLSLPDASGDDSRSLMDSLGSEDGELERVEYRESLKPLLDELPEREKTILQLRFYRNMTQSQIAEEIGISQMHVSRLISRACARLREGLFEGV
jgi:RNA polymerase sigma-B factor